MKLNTKLRAAFAGALTLGLLASGAGSAFAAPGDALNPQSNGSKGSFFLWDANTFDSSDGNPARVYTRSEALVGSAKSTDFLTEINPSATRPVTGATPFTEVYRFISLKTAADVAGGINTWKAFSIDSAAGANGGTLLPDMTLDAFDGVDTLIGTGGSFWYGVAYTINNGVTTIGAVYREITITAGSGNYTVGPVETETPICTPVNTDFTTTTSLVADKTEVDQGGPAVLTASVSASKALPSSNVEFFQGTTSLGSVGLASGSAAKTVIVGAVGANTYSAKYVENVVETAACPAKTTDTFKASASTDITVIGKAPTVPNGPNEIALNAATANGATATYDAVTHKATLTVNASNNGKTVNVFGYSTPTYFGKQTVASDKISVDVSVLSLATHKLAITDIATGDVIAWASFDKTDIATKPTFGKTINADVAALDPVDGEFSLTNLSGDTVNLTNPALVNGASVVSGELGNFKVTDLRQVSTPGWSLKTDVAQFAKGTDTIAASALGIAPTVVSQAGTGATAPTLGAAQVSGSASYPWNFAELAGSKFSGVSTYNADLVFTAPAAAPAGTYTSTLTLTLISN